MKKQKKKASYFQKFLTLFGIILLLLIISYFFYLIERFILFYPIYFFLNTIITLLFRKSEQKKVYIIILSIAIIIIVHFFILQIIILSIIFISGGLFSRFSFYNKFIIFINQQKALAKKSLNYLSLYGSFENELNDLMSLISSFQKAYNNLKMRNSTTFEIKKYEIGYYLNEIIDQYNIYKEGNYSSADAKNNLIQSLKQYQINLDSYRNLSFIDIILKFNYKKSLELLQELMLNSFKGRTCFIVKISDNFNAYIISPEKKNSNIKNLVIFCGQNAFNVETLSFSREIIQFYLNIKEITILVWNYKGYGLRRGFPSFESIEEDIEDLKEYINKYYIDYNIIIHGISIGGYPSIKLSKILKFNNICLIADRTYADIDLLAENFIKYGKKLYNILFPKFLYNTDNIQNYIDIPKRNKIIFFDEEDEIINYYQSSLIYALTKKYYNEILLPKISNYIQYRNIIKIISEGHKNLGEELRRVKIINNNKNNLEENSLILINNLMKNITNLGNFLMYFLVFGYPFNSNKEINYDKTFFLNIYINLPGKMKSIIEKDKTKFNENLINFLSDLNFLFIKSNLITSLNNEKILSFSYNNDNEEFSLQEGFKENIIKYFGYVHRIFCKHNGILNDEDKNYLLKFFEINQFIK